MIKKVKNNVVSDLKSEENVGAFYEKELQKAKQREFRIGKVIKRNNDKLYVKWKCFDYSFNSWIDQKYIV